MCFLRSGYLSVEKRMLEVRLHVCEFHVRDSTDAFTLT
jgi:hypothetical protein